MTYIKNILIAIDQVGNTLAAGNPDNTISGRTGYFAKYAKDYARWYWLTLQLIINVTFFPFDGWGHCAMAYELEIDEEFYYARKAALVVFGFIAVGSCLILIAPFYLIYGIKLLIKMNNHGRNE